MQSAAELCFPNFSVLFNIILYLTTLEPYPILASFRGVNPYFFPSFSSALYKIRHLPTFSAHY